MRTAFLAIVIITLAACNGEEDASSITGITTPSSISVVPVD
ncbi:hypothetical protein N9D77_09815 [Paracoccaceae bacterium]|nr:hypothetical protein [Paracoccaceae bacterium]